MIVQLDVMRTGTILLALLMLIVPFTLIACDAVEMDTGATALPPSPTLPLPTFTPAQVAPTLTPIPATHTPTSVPPTLAPTSVPPTPTKLPTPIPARPAVEISPSNGPSGTLVQVIATGFPANALITIGLGPANSQFTEAARGTTDAAGRFVAQVRVQGETGMNWVFGANAGRVVANSTFFRITGGGPVGLKTYTNSYFKIALQYPGNWQMDPQYSDPQSGQKFVGQEGFFLIGAMDGDTIDQVTLSEAHHKLRPYGSQPSISSQQIQGREARLVLPSTDQPIGMVNQSLLVVRYPNPVTISGQPCRFFALYVDRNHILTIAQTLRFD